MNAELAVVNQAEAALTGYGSGTRLLIQASREQKIKGIRSILASEMTVPAEFEVAISAILGETLQAVLVDENVDNALDLLLNQSTQGIVLPLPELASEESDTHILAGLQSDSDFIGRAVDLVEATAGLQPVIELVLDKAFLVRDRSAARRIFAELRSIEPRRVAFICLATLDGQVFYPAASELKAGHPNLCVVGTGYSYLQEWLAHVAQNVVRTGKADFVGLGRMVLAYPEMVADVLEGRPLQRKRICRTFSDCTTAPRKGLVSGCYPLDDFYKTRPEAALLKEAK